MKAAIITAFDPYLFKGGIESYTLQLIRLLERRGITVDVYQTGMIDDDLGLHYRIMGKMFALGQKLYREDAAYDLIISNSFYGLGYFPPRRKAFNIYHSTHVAFDKSAGGIISPVTSLELTYLCGFVGEAVSGFGRGKIAVSGAVKEELERYYGFSDACVVESGVDTRIFRALENRDELRRRYSVPEDAFVGLFVGRWDKTKGRHIIENIVQRRRDIHWILVLGTGGEECVLCNEPNVTILQEVPHEEMPLVYSSSDFVLFPSQYEGFGLVIVEAMACAVPVLTGEVGIAKKIYQAAPFSELRLRDVSSEGDASIAEASDKIDRLRRDGEWRRYVSDKGVALVNEHYTIEHWSAHMMEALELA